MMAAVDVSGDGGSRPPGLCEETTAASDQQTRWTGTGRGRRRGYHGDGTLCASTSVLLFRNEVFFRPEIEPAAKLTNFSELEEILRVHQKPSPNTSGSVFVLRPGPVI